MPPAVQSKPVPPTPLARPSRPFQVFSVGEYGGFNYTQEFLQAACANFKAYQKVDVPIGFPKPPAVLIDNKDLDFAGVSIGHEDVRVAELAESGDDLATLLADALMKRTDQPASAWVRNLFMVGDAVFAELDGMPFKLAQDCEAGLYQFCSAEWYKDFEGASGIHYGPMLRRIAILGGEIPKLKHLGRLPPMVFSETHPMSMRGQTILCFSEARQMSHDEIVIALSAFMPNAATLADAGFGDDQLAALLKCFQEGNGDSAPAVNGEMDDNIDPSQKPITNSDDGPGATGVGSTGDDNSSGRQPGALPNGELLKPGNLGTLGNTLPATYSEMKRAIARLDKERLIAAQQNKMAAQLIKTMSAEAKHKIRKDVEAFCEQMVKEGKVTPFENGRVDSHGKPKPSLADRLLNMDGTNKVFANSEGQKISVREFEMEEIRRRPKVLRNSESMQHGKPLAGATIQTEADRVEALKSSPLGRRVLDREARAAGKLVTADNRHI